jgi:hypothetical protein
MSSEAVACPKCGRPAGARRSQRLAAVLAGGMAVLLAGLGALISFTGHKGSSANYHRAVHSAVRERVAFFYDVRANCEMEGYPEINVVQRPTQGNVSAEQGKAYPEYTRDNIRFDCDRNLTGATLVFYQSEPGYHGQDAFTITVRFPDSVVWTESYIIDVL